MMSPLAAGDETASPFDAAAFEVLTSDFAQDTAASAQQHADTMRNLTSHQQQQGQQRQHKQNLSSISQPQQQQPQQPTSSKALASYKGWPPPCNNSRGSNSNIKQQSQQQQQQPQSQQQGSSQTLSPSPQQHGGQGHMSAALVPASVMGQQAQQSTSRGSSPTTLKAAGPVVINMARPNNNLNNRRRLSRLGPQQPQQQYAGAQQKQTQYTPQYQSQSPYSTQAQQPQYSSQQRHQQNIATSSPSLIAQSVAHQSPQFGTTMPLV